MEKGFVGQGSGASSEVAQLFDRSIRSVSLHVCGCQIGSRQNESYAFVARMSARSVEQLRDPRLFMSCADVLTQSSWLPGSRLQMTKRKKISMSCAWSQEQRQGVASSMRHVWCRRRGMVIVGVLGRQNSTVSNFGRGRFFDDVCSEMSPRSRFI
mmetsp:Transcript_120156/g.384926  ORF Transcript_120156/g.384926 Transcript_120156/m.384926 type:complete len:155 (+) Transcript_120156:2356-2820(+)